MVKRIHIKNAIAEVALIFLGITLAVTFNNWNDYRKARQLEKTILQELKLSLSKDLLDINVNIVTLQQKTSIIQRLLEEMSAEAPPPDSIIIGGMMATLSNTFLVSDISTYEYLKSVGLHTIVNDSLRNQITTLYEVSYQSITGKESGNEMIVQKMFNRIPNYLNADGEQTMLSKNWEQLQADHQFRFDLKMVQLIKADLFQNYLQKIEPQVTTLVAAIDKELERW